MLPGCSVLRAFPQTLGQGSALRHVLLGGEPFPSWEQLKDIWPQDSECAFHNLYGVTGGNPALAASPCHPPDMTTTCPFRHSNPAAWAPGSEMSIWQTMASCPREWLIGSDPPRPLPLGEPLQDTTLYLRLSDAPKTLVPLASAGSTAELEGELIVASQTRRCWSSPRQSTLATELALPYAYVAATGDLVSVVPGTPLTLVWLGRLNHLVWSGPGARLPRGTGSRQLSAPW